MHLVSALLLCCFLSSNHQLHLSLAEDVSKISASWRDRLSRWKDILEKEKLSEQSDSVNAKYVVEFDMKLVEESLRRDVTEKVSDTRGTRAKWISKRWWRYRPKLPYTYFLEKLDSSEVMSLFFPSHSIH